MDITISIQSDVPRECLICAHNTDHGCAVHKRRDCESLKRIAEIKKKNMGAGQNANG